METNIIVLELFIAPVLQDLYLIDHLQELSIGYICLQVSSSPVILHQLALLVSSEK